MVKRRASIIIKTDVGGERTIFVDKPGVRAYTEAIELFVGTHSSRTRLPVFCPISIPSNSSVGRNQCAPNLRRIEMIRWLLMAAVAFLIIAALQQFTSSRRQQKPLEGSDAHPKLPPLPDATELEKSRRELHELEQRLDITHSEQPGKGA